LSLSTQARRGRIHYDVVELADPYTAPRRLHLSSPTPKSRDRGQRRPFTTLAAVGLIVLPAWASAQLAVPNNPLSPRPAEAERVARPEGGLYIAGDGFNFQVAAERAMRQNPFGQRFFLLSLPPETAALTTAADRQQTRLRKQVVAAGGVLLVCQRDIERRRIDAALLASEVVPVRGFPPQGNGMLPDDRRYFDDEDRNQLPAANDALRLLRSTCS
jgi:hypothetical protein